MPKKLFLIAAVLVAVLSTGLAEAADPAARSVSIVRGRLSPHALRVASGTTLTWRNLDASPREVVIVRARARDGQTRELNVRSGSLAAYTRGAAPAAFTHTFVEPGSYELQVGTSKGSVIVDAPRTPPGQVSRTPTATASAGTPTATATPRAPAATRTPRPTHTPQPIPTVAPWPPAELPAGWQRGYCGGWEAQRLNATSVHLTGECIFPTGGFQVKTTPRQLEGSALLVDKRMTAPTGAAAQVAETVPVSVMVSAGPERREIVVMPDRVRVPIRDVSID